MLFQSYDQILFPVNRLIVSLEENTARNPEFDYDLFELADVDDSESKANFTLKRKHDLPELAETLHLPEGFCYSQRQKEKKLQRCT